MKLFNTSIIATLLVIVSGCANLNSVHRELKVGDGVGALVDIKQRGIFVSKDARSPSGTIVCAEPSPDALSAYAAELAGKADISGKGSAELSHAFQESASFTGLRTQTIQLLRDSRYRDCEAFMNGALSQTQYDNQARRHQKIMTALMAIEQLTGVIRSPSVTINTAGSAEVAHSIAEMRVELTEIDKAIADFEKKKAGLAEDEKSKVDEKIKLLQSSKDSISKGIESARGLLATGSATSIISNAGIPTQRSDAHIQAVTDAVKEITLSITRINDFPQICLDYLQRDSENLNPNAKQIQVICATYFKYDQLLKESDTESKQEQSANSAKAKKDTTDGNAKTVTDIRKNWLDSTKTVKPPSKLKAVD
ncbi:MAG: hypothetical protein HOP21_12480 [Methylotenera sp.]|nr:hypothetical protein [Methylotenera sp.]